MPTLRERQLAACEAWLRRWGASAIHCNGMSVDGVLPGGTTVRVVGCVRCDAPIPCTFDGAVWHLREHDCTAQT